MNERKYAILILEYDQNCEAEVQEIIKGVEKSVTKCGKISKAYQGSDESIVSAVEKILRLTK